MSMPSFADASCGVAYTSSGMLTVFAALAITSAAWVLVGLGYNRRAKYLLEAAALLRGREFPRTVEELVKLKGVSRNTASAILTYAFNQKHIFVETNIRTVIIATFFSQSGSVEDKQIESKLEELLDVYSGNYCEFYWAIMDYGTYLKKQGNKAHQKSKLYKKQSSFPGSVRHPEQR
jgi:A/G-specific adenine glycosylase